MGVGRKLRSPRYAPESLERRLSPTTLAPVMTTAYFDVWQVDSRFGTQYCFVYHNDDWEPPIVFPTPLPIGPNGPA